MRIKILVLTAILVAAAPAAAQSVIPSITLTTTQEPAVQARTDATNVSIAETNVVIVNENQAALNAWNAENIRRAAADPVETAIPGPPTPRAAIVPWTLQDFVNSEFQAMLNGIVASGIATEADLLRTDFIEADETKRDSIRDANTGVVR